MSRSWNGEVVAGRRIVAFALGAVLLTALPAAAAVPYPDTPLDGWDTNGPVYAVKVVGDTVYVGGSFTEARPPGDGPAVPRSNLAAFDMVTGDVLAFAADTDDEVRAIESDGSTVWVGGNFTSIGGLTRHHIAALDAGTGAVRTSFDVGNNGAVYGLALGPSRLFASGYFTAMAGIQQERVASLDPETGQPDPRFDAGADLPVRDVAVSPLTGQLVVGGQFLAIGGADRPYFAQLDPATGRATGPAFEYAVAPVLDVDITPDGSLAFAAVAGGQNRVQAWSTLDGSRRWYHVAMGDTQAVAYYQGIVYFGFHEGFQDNTNLRLLAADAVTGELQDLRPTVNTFFGVWAIDAGASGLAVGGTFTRIAGVPTRRIAMFSGEPVPPEPPPAAPVGLVGDEQVGGRVHLEWDAPAGNVGIGYYHVFRDGTEIGITLDPAFTDQTVAEGTFYAYQVRASDLDGNLSAASNALLLKTRTNLVVAGESWRHSDTPQTTAAWREIGFADQGWESGNAQLGFGDGDESTLITPGAITYYFRRTVTLPAEVIAAATLGLIRDDGAVVYVNGQEVFRTNMPTGSIDPSTPASGTTGGSAESQWFTTSVDPAVFQVGANVIAVEVHQRVVGSSDVSFDFRLSVDLTGEVIDVESPTRPLRLRAIPKSPRRVKLRWDAASDDVGVVGYFVYRDGVEVGYTTGLWFSDRWLWPATSYRYKVRAVDEVGNLSVRSRYRVVETPADDVPPRRAKNVTLSSTAHSVTVSWDPAFDNVAIDHYRVKLGGKLLTTTTDTSFTIQGLDPGTQYRVAVKAVDVFGNVGRVVIRFINTPDA